MNAYRIFMKKHAIQYKFEYKQKKNHNLKIELVCKDLKCKWRVYIRKVPHEQTALLRAYMSEHTYKSDKKCKNCLACAGWVANVIEEQIRNHKEFKPKDIQAKIWQQFGVKVSYSTAYTAITICHERIHGK